MNGAARFLLPRQDVKKYILPFVNEEEQTRICNELRGDVNMRAYDMNTKTKHILTVRK